MKTANNFFLLNKILEIAYASFGSDNVSRFPKEFISKYKNESIENMEEFLKKKIKKMKIHSKWEKQNGKREEENCFIK